MSLDYGQFRFFQVFIFFGKSCVFGENIRYLMYIVYMSFKDEIFRLLDDDSLTLVFPTENSSRYWLSAYARERGCSILASRAIAFDRFKEMFSPSDERRPADKYHRMAFTASFLGNGNTGMNYLYSDRCHSYFHRFVPFLMSILPSLAETDSVKMEEGMLSRDLQILKSAYGAFLEKQGLYEPLWEKCSVGNASDFSGHFVLVGYDADIQMQKLMADIGDVANITKLTLQCPKEPKYLKYLTSEAELEALFLKLQELKEKGVPTDDIIISTPAADELRPFMERKSREYNTPLTFMRSLKLSETLPGRYLFSVRRCIGEGLSFRSLEALLLNSSLPFRDMDTNRRLIRFMIDHNHNSGRLEFSEDQLLKDLSKDAREKGDERMFNFYRSLKNALAAIKRSKDGDELIKAIHGLTALLLGNDEFSASDSESKDVYSFIFSKLAEFCTTLRQCSLSVGNLFSIFMGDVENLSYVAQQKKNGIRVYEYGQDYLLDVPYHFLVGLNDSNANVRRRPLGFLEDYEAEGRTELDVTEPLLGYYQSLSPNVFISGSETSYSGSQSSPAFFVKQNAVIEMVLPYSEPVFEKADFVSFSQARQTSFSAKGLDLTKEGPGPVMDPDSKKLSYTAISTYANCPYSEYLRQNMTQGVPDAFEPAKQDDKEIGSFLHTVIQAFMSNHMDELLEEDFLDDYYEEITRIMDGMLEENRVFDDFTKASIRGRYLESLFSILDILLIPSSKKAYIGPFIPRKNEQRLDKNPHFIGYIDTVLEDPNGQIYLLDYKKGEGKATYQLVLYQRLFKEENPDKEVKDCFFYSMRDRTFHGFKPADWDLQQQKLDSDIELTLSGYRRGDWIATPSKDACKGCSERSICRRRFNLQ